MKAQYIPPTTTASRKKRLASIFRNQFIFGETDPRLSDDLVHDLGSFEYGGRRVDLIGVGTDTEHRDNLLVNLYANQCETITLNFEVLPTSRYAIEGVAGLGKSTLLAKFDGARTDLQELRDHPTFGVLTGMSEDHLAYRLKARQWLATDKWLLDRSDFLAPTVYSGYARGAMILYLDKAQRDFITNDPYQTVVLKPNIPLTEVAARIVQRGKMDMGVPLDYTMLSYSLFNAAAYCYNIPLVEYDAFEAQCATWAAPLHD